ncbi:hypothetical protein HDU84_006148 [Entophlyctis sp. JEL0112]|nr:hypothetical protein HDU84_006148 [Entophlyctis sp. JEL0112]
MADEDRGRNGTGADESGDRSHAEPRGRDRRDDGIKSLFVRGLANGTRAEDLTAAFENYGVVKDEDAVYIPKDYYSGNIKGFAYIHDGQDPHEITAGRLIVQVLPRYSSQEEATKAYDKIEYLTINGRRLTVEWAQGDRKTPNEMRSKEGGGRSGGRRRSVDRYSSRNGRYERSRSRSRDRRRSRSRFGLPAAARDLATGRETEKGTGIVTVVGTDFLIR